MQRRKAREMTMFEAILLTIATAATPLLIAALGELVVERSGVLNLGVEGMMIMGAVSGSSLPAQMTGSAWLGLLAAVLAGAAFSLLFGFLTLTPGDQSSCYRSGTHLAWPRSFRNDR